MRHAIVLMFGLAVVAVGHANPQQEGCGFAQGRTANGRVPVYMGTVERTYRICTAAAPTSNAKRLEIYADGSAAASLPTHKAGGKGLCVDVGGKRIEVGFDQDDYPFVYSAVNALTP